MASYKQILILVVVLVTVKGASIIRMKREGPEAIASFFMDKAAEGMAILEHGAGYKGQQNHQFDFFGAKAGIDAKPNVGFGDTARNEDAERKKRQAGNTQQGQQGGAEDIQNIFQQMWGAVMEGGKKIFNKIGEMIDPEAAERQKHDQQQQQQQQQQTY